MVLTGRELFDGFVDGHGAWSNSSKNFAERRMRVAGGARLFPQVCAARRHPLIRVNRVQGQARADVGLRANIRVISRVITRFGFKVQSCPSLSAHNK